LLFKNSWICQIAKLIRNSFLSFSCLNYYYDLCFILVTNYTTQHIYSSLHCGIAWLTTKAVETNSIQYTPSKPLVACKVVNRVSLPGSCHVTVELERRWKTNSRVIELALASRLAFVWDVILLHRFEFDRNSWVAKAEQLAFSHLLFNVLNVETAPSYPLSITLM